MNKKRGKGGEGAIGDDEGWDDGGGGGGGGVGPGSGIQHGKQYRLATG